MAKRESSPGIRPAKKNKYGIEAGQILMQNIQERLTGLWPATGSKQQAYCKVCSKHFSVSHGGIDDVRRHGEGLKTDLKKKNHGFSAVVPHFFPET